MPADQTLIQKELKKIKKQQDAEIDLGNLRLSDIIMLNGQHKTFILDELLEAWDFE